VNWDQIIVALITGVFLIITTTLPIIMHRKDAKLSKARWDANGEDHGKVMLALGKLDQSVKSSKTELSNTAKSLGISIDRVEETALRTEQKLDTHIRDHAMGDL
jgi:hypothetical protein